MQCTTIVVTDWIPSLMKVKNVLVCDEHDIICQGSHRDLKKQEMYEKFLRNAISKHKDDAKISRALKNGIKR